MSKLSRSLVYKLILAFLLVSLAEALLLSLMFGLRTRQEFDRFLVDRRQVDVVDELTRYYRRNRDWRGLENDLDRPPFEMRDGRTLPLTLTDDDGRVILSRQGYQTGQQLTPAQRAESIPLRLEGRTVGFVLGADFALNEPQAPTPPENSFISRVRRFIVVGALTASAIALVLGIFITRTLTRPLGELTAATRSVARGNLGRQVAVRSQDELGQLATSFNQMSADLARESEQRRQMTADIAHDLRTPLSVIMGYTEALSEGVLRGDPEMFTVMHKEAQQLSHLIDDLRTLALADAGELTLNQQSVPAYEMLAHTAAAHAHQATQQGIDLTVDADATEVAVKADPERMAQVLSNLVSNALRFTPDGGTIALGAHASNGQVILSVRDSGRGIAAEDLPYIFDRFYRGDKARVQAEGESGLGLAIAKSIVDAHGGEITAESAPGAGTTFRIVLPRADTA